MPRKGLPIIVRLSEPELAHALGLAPDDSSVQRMGGITVVLRPVSDPGTQSPASLPLVGAIGGPPTFRALAGAFRAVPRAIFKRLESDPELAKRFVLDPASTERELGVDGAGACCDAKVLRRR